MPEKTTPTDTITFLGTGGARFMIISQLLASGGFWLNLGGTEIQSAYVLKTTAITMRRDPIFQALLTGMPMTENHILKKWALAAAIYRALVSVVPHPKDINGINLTTGGSGNYHAVVSIHKRSTSTPRDIIYTILAMRLVTGMVTVVDEDINIYDPNDVEWAITTRAQPDRDIIILPTIPPSAGSPVHPAFSRGEGVSYSKKESAL